MRARARITGLVAAVGLVAGLMGSVPAVANHNADDHSKNVEQLAQKPTKISKGLFAQGSDLAFQRKLLVAGTYQGTGFYKILKKKPYIRQIGFHACPGSQGDVSVWGDLVFVSIDSPSSNNGGGNNCNNTKALGPDDTVNETSAGLEGVRIVDISNPSQPRQVGFVQTDCGSHTHTLVPDGRQLFIYVESYPLGANQLPPCSVATHRKISVIKVNKKNPQKSDVVSTPSVDPAIGCHDVTVFPKRDLAAAACISESQIWDIEDPKNPEILAHVEHPPGMTISHSSGFTWDGKKVIFSEEYAGAAGGGGCTGDEDSNVGAMFFYDISGPNGPESPTLEGWHSLPRVPPFHEDEVSRTVRCTTHNYNILPTKKSTRYVAVSSYYMGGLSIVNFTNPENPREVGHYLPKKGGVLPDMWSAYWYNGRIYTNEHESRKGVSVFKAKNFGKHSIRYFKGRLNPQTQIPSFK
ncbi:MAG: hypothetical protein M3174_04950 [Actinomycetota bacterium]|nr:hypothetical protein [Actinomycetota bacterium]